MDEKDLLIQRLRQKIAEQTHDIKVYNELLNSYQKLLNMAVLEIDKRAEKLREEVTELNEYISREIQNETGRAGKEDRETIQG